MKLDTLKDFPVKMVEIKGKIVPVIDVSKVKAEITEHPDGRRDVKITLPRLNLFGQPKSVVK